MSRLVRLRTPIKITKQVMESFDISTYAECSDWLYMVRLPTFISCSKTLQLPCILKRALGGGPKATSGLIGMEGHRSQIWFRSHSAAWHFGSVHIFVTPNWADVCSPIMLQLHLQTSGPVAQHCRIPRSSYEALFQQVAFYRTEA